MWFFRQAPPQYRGYIDAVADGRVHGWAWNGVRPNQRLDIEILSAGARLGVARADIFRADLAANAIGDGGYAFRFELPEPPPPRETIAARIAGADFYLIDNGRPFDAAFQNSTARGLPGLRPALSRRAPDDEDEAIAEELQRLWRTVRGEKAAAALEDRRQMWGHIVAARHRQLRSALAGGAPRRLAEVLVNIQKSAAAEGLMQGDRAYRDFLAASPEGRRAAVAPFHDMLASLAQYVGAFRAECAEQDFSGIVVADASEALAAKIELALAEKCAARDWIAPPNMFDGLYGLAVGERVVHARDIQALYAALRAIESSEGAATPAICEIGGGFGKLGHYAMLLGARRYSIIDLPTVAAMQYFYLRKTLPKLKIAFGAADPTATIELVFASNLPQRLDADIVVNVDSFPEMGDAVCRAYLARLPYWGPTLLSINQEAARDIRGPRHRQSVVGALAPEFGYTRSYRFRSWVRRGYVEELWRTPKGPCA